MKINIKDLTESELIYLAEDLICILDCRARNDDEFATPDDLVKDNLIKAPILLDMAGWHDEAQTLRQITLENITDNVDFLYDLEWQCLATIGGTDDPINVRYNLFREGNIFEFENGLCYVIT